MEERKAEVEHEEVECAMYTEVGLGGQKPRSVLRETEPSLSHSRSALTLSLDSKTRSRRYRHKRSHSHENYLKLMTPRNSPHLEHVSNSILNYIFS